MSTDTILRQCILYMCRSLQTLYTVRDVSIQFLSLQSSSSHGSRSSLKMFHVCVTTTLPNLAHNYTKVTLNPLKDQTRTLINYQHKFQFCVSTCSME